MPMLTVTQFVERINPDKKYNRIEVLIDTKLYPNTFGINVRPIYINLWAGNSKTVIDMKGIIDMFDGICYLRVNESKYRRLSREPSLLVIITTPRQYEEHTYYDYRISKLFLLDEISRYNAIYTKAHDIMKQYKEDNKKLSEEEQGNEIEI